MIFQITSIVYLDQIQFVHLISNEDSHPVMELVQLVLLPFAWNLLFHAYQDTGYLGLIHPAGIEVNFNLKLDQIISWLK